MDVSTVVRLRGCAVTAVMTCTFVRVGAVAALAAKNIFGSKRAGGGCACTKNTVR
jgi:hypothetical protein